MPPRKQHDQEQEKTIQEIIAEEIAKRFVPIYWGLSGFGVFLLTAIWLMAGPLNAEIITISKEVTKMITIDSAFSRFITKDQYHQLQKDEHVSDIEAVQNPENAEVIYMKQNNRESEKLGVSYNRGNSND